MERYIKAGALNQINNLEKALSMPFFNISKEVKALESAVLSINTYLQSSGNLLKDANIDLKGLSQECGDYDSIR